MDNHPTLEEFRSKFKVQDLLIRSTAHWSWSVRPAQVTLGAGIISLNRYALRLSDVTPEEMSDLAILVKQAEGALFSVFQYDIMNYLMLMMVDRHVHYHVIPRYSSTRSFAGLEWQDNGWPALPVMPDAQHKDKSEILPMIRDALSAACAA